MNRQKRIIEMNKLQQIRSEKDLQNIDSKPEKLAKIMYEGIVRYTKAKSAQVREKSSGFAVDFSGDRRVNVHTKDY
jgi:hypothetical protein